jgi:hypothetical protein
MDGAVKSAFFAPNPFHISLPTRYDTRLSGREPLHQFERSIIMPKVIKKPRTGGSAASQSAKKAPNAAMRRGLNGNGDAEHNGGVENLDKVRDILFGSQMRDNEKRFARLEERVLKESTDVREEGRKRLESLEGFVRKEVQSLVERGKSEQGARVDAIKEVNQEIKESAKTLQSKVTEIQDHLDEAQRQLRQEVLDQSKALRDELSKSRVEQTAMVESIVNELRSSKIDRSALADLFTEMAARLGDVD